MVRCFCEQVWLIGKVCFAEKAVIDGRHCSALGMAQTHGNSSSVSGHSLEEAV
jgi:hypothetical protein